MTLPTALTIFRIAVIPVLVLAIGLNWHGLWVGAIFGLAAISDWLDGYFARRLGQTSRFGAFLDPVADKLVIVTVLVMLTWQQDNLLFTVPAVVMICREVTISALREWMAQVDNRQSVSVSVHGKIKATLQFIALLSFIVWGSEPPLYSAVVSYVLLYIATVMTLMSMVIYLISGWSQLDWDGSLTGPDRDDLGIKGIK